MAEIEALGIGFAIDHYQPQEFDGSDSYENLFWTCQQCNRNKSDYWPTATTLPDHRILRIDVENPEDHFDTDPNDPNQIVEKTELGKFNIAWLRLNRPRMTKLRKLRREALHAEVAIRSGLRTLAQMRLDDLPPELKARAYAIRTRLNNSAVAAEEVLEQTMRALAEEYSKSELLDNDENPQEQRERKEYLRSIGVLKKPSDRRKR